MILLLLKLTSLIPSNIEIQAITSPPEKQKNQTITHCQLTFTNLQPNHTYKLAFLREDKTEYLSYNLTKKTTPEELQLIDFDNYRGLFISLEDQATKEKSLYRYFPHEQMLQIDGITISLVSLDPRGRNLLCKMRGFEPYEPFLCQAIWKEENIIEGTANADGTYTYLLSHSNFDKGVTDPFTLYRSSTKQTSKTTYTWGKALMRGKRNRIISSIKEGLNNSCADSTSRKF
ncbi:MAG: hypothetical protein SNF33_03595 [Candidatus Algichlamydia australiensis]|nr:hypothetical protein [Chlamydiales bacterium]